VIVAWFFFFAGWIFGVVCGWNAAARSRLGRQGGAHLRSRGAPLDVPLDRIVMPRGSGVASPQERAARLLETPTEGQDLTKSFFPLNEGEDPLPRRPPNVMRR
jgi:hypothetical protein